MPSISRTPAIAVTGGAGMMAALLRPYLRDAGYGVRLIDLAWPGDLTENETALTGSVDDTEFMTRALQGTKAVIHLGGIHREKPWDDIVRTNITGTQVTLEAARSNGVERVLLASSTHTVGFNQTTDAARPEALPPRPDTYYGVSKAAMEALGGLYADKFGMKVVSARIGTGGERPDNVRSLSSWLSPGDMFRLVEATLNDLGSPGHHVVWAVSNNTRGWADLSAGRRIGFNPQDDAEAYAGQVDTAVVPNEWDSLLGGRWASSGHRVGVDNYPELDGK